MKTIYLALVVILFSLFNLQAQDEIEYRKSTNLDSYVGTWEYATATDTFQIILVKAQWITNRSINDCLYGVHYYKKNGKVIADCRYLVNELTDDNQTVYATNAVTQEDIAYFTQNQLDFSFWDKEHRKMSDGYIIRDPAKPNEFLWEFEKKRKKWHEVVYFSDTPESEKELPGYSVPDNVILKKIK